MFIRRCNISDIVVLPESLSNKIAAGETIDRPASIVKELIENSIDANSTKITIELNEGGKSLIRISDNGLGMDKKDAFMSLKRHATSKIKKDEDLYAIKTLGFRGEAIPSIVAVSKFDMITKKNNNNIGTRIIANGGKIHKYTEYGTTSGTMTTIKDIFYNMPVRKKFLKSTNTETNNIINIITAAALTNPKIYFKLIHNNKTIKYWLDTDNYSNRIKNFFGKNISKKLIKVKIKKENFNIKSWISHPQLNRTTSKYIYIFVNERWVKNEIIYKALMSAYKNKITKGKYPIAIIYIKTPYNQIDINVHPRKHEIRFINSNKIYKILNTTFSKSIKKLENKKWNHSANINFLNENDKSTIKIIKPKNKKQNISTIEKYIIDNNIKIISNNYNSNKKYNTKQKTTWSKNGFSNLNIIGQYQNTYILCESKNSLILIDQHVAHEQIIFEKLKQKTYKNISKPKKTSMQISIELTHNEIKNLKKIIPYLQNYGFHIELPNENILSVKSIPSFIKKNKISDLLLELIEKKTNTETKNSINKAINKYLSKIACYNAIKANQKLNKHEMHIILKNLDNCQNFSYCPHGRPIWIGIDWSSIKKKFRRLS